MLIKINKIAITLKYIKYSFSFKKFSTQFDRDIESLENENNNLYENNSNKVDEILKVSKLSIMNSSIKNVIEVLYMCAIYKKYDPNLILSIEKKLNSVLKDLNDYDLMKIIYSFSVMNYGSNNLNFLIERVLINRIEKFDINTFLKIFNSINSNKSYKISLGLKNVLRSFIDLHSNNMNNNQIADSFINLYKIVDDDILYKLYNKMDKVSVNINKLAYIYFLIYGKSSKMKDLKYDNEYTNIFINNIDNLNSKMIYLIFITYYFSDNKEMSKLNQLSYLIEKKFLQYLNDFEPEEINTIVMIINNTKYISNNLQNIKDINEKFIQITLNDINDMNINEMILYLQGLLSLPSCKTEVISILEENIYKYKFSSIDMYEAVSLLDLISCYGIDKFKYINLNNLTEQILTKLKFKSTKDLSPKILDDYYIISVLLLDLRFRDLGFWKEYLNYFNIFKAQNNDLIKIDKILKIIDILNREILDLKFESS